MSGEHENPRLELARIAGDTARHYGTMRFAMFTVFSAVLGALLSFAFSQGGTLFIAHAPHRVGLAAAGGALSVLFLLAELRISRLVTFYQEAAYAAGALPRPPGHERWKGVIVLTMVAPYAFSAVFWLLAGCGFIVFPLYPAAAG